MKVMLTMKIPSNAKALSESTSWTRGPTTVRSVMATPPLYVSMRYYLLDTNMTQARGGHCCHGRSGSAHRVGAVVAALGVGATARPARRAPPRAGRAPGGGA